MLAGAALLLAGRSGSGLAALALPLGALSLLIGAPGRYPVRSRWLHRHMR